jgi:ankyrin repeat protein
MNRAQRLILAAALLMPVSAAWVQGDTEQTPIALPAPAPVTVDFREHILPILESKCFACHGPRQQEAGLRLDLRQNAMRGGAYGPVIVPGRSAESKLILRVSGPMAGLQMPPTGALEADEIGLLRAWIDQGAEMPGRAIDPEPAPSATHPNVKAFFDTILGKDNAAVRAAMQADRTLVNAADASGTTALMRAAYAGTIEMVTALLDAGADVKGANTRRSTALHWAVADPAKVRALLLAGADVNAATMDGRTALHIAALRSDGAPIVRLLLAAGANVDATTITGNTPLFSAASSSIDTARILLAHGANPNATSKIGATPLLVAALTNSGVMPLLIESGANVKAATKRGDTALAFAAHHGDIDAARLLLDKGADVNSVDSRGYTPLMHAAYYDHATPALIRLLLDRGAEVLVTGGGETPIGIAAKRGENDVTRLLREYTARSQRQPRQ